MLLLKYVWMLEIVYSDLLSIPDCKPTVKWWDVFFLSPLLFKEAMKLYLKRQEGHY